MSAEYDERVLDYWKIPNDEISSGNERRGWIGM